MGSRSRARRGLTVLFCLLSAAASFAGGHGEKPAAAKGFIVGLSNGPFALSWRVEMLESLHTQFDFYREKGWARTLFVRNAGPDVDIQIAQIKDLIAQRVNLLLVNPNSPTALNPVLAEARDAGVLVIVQGEAVEPPDGALNILVDQESRQAALAAWLAAQLNGAGNIVYISGIADQPATIARDRAANAVLARYPGITVLAAANGNCDEAAAEQVMTGLLGSYPDIDGVLTQEGMTRGIIRAFEAAGRKLPPVTGETQVAFIREWKQRRQSGFSSVAVEDSPGAICTSLGIGLRLLQGRKLKPEVLIDPATGRPAPGAYTIWTRPLLQVDNSNIDRIYGDYKDWADSSYVNTWYTEEQIDALFQ